VGHSAPLRRRGGLPSSGERRVEQTMTDPLSQDLYRLTHDPVDIAGITQHVRGSADGAIVIFDGFVRNHSHNRETLYLDYEAYEPMAVTKMEQIGIELHAKFPIHRVAIVHRLGRLQIGETSVLIAVSSQHRPAAFDACRYAIDILKRTVPIWKKEYFVDGAVWADGELPPVRSGRQETAKPPATPDADSAS